MNICSNEHQEIAYEGSSCPLCEKLNEVGYLISDLNDAIRNVDKFRDRCLQLEDEVAELSKQISDLERE